MELHEAFRNSIAEYNYGVTGVFPMKVNQKRSVVERLMAAGTGTNTAESGPAEPRRLSQSPFTPTRC
jgi:arginine decarboxylase-like protein